MLFRSIVNLTQGSKSVREYAAEFELNTGRLESSDEATLMQFFIWGLHRDIAERVSIMHPTSLSQAIASAEEIELAVNFLAAPLSDIRLPTRGELQDRVVPFLRETLKDAGEQEEEDQVEDLLSMLVAKGPSNPRKTYKRKIEILVGKANFDAMSAGRLGIFVQIALDFDRVVPPKGTRSLGISDRILVHDVGGIDRKSTRLNSSH